jgi:septal ring factor EnvC (AmiA/AmiB activator)
LPKRFFSNYYHFYIRKIYTKLHYILNQFAFGPLSHATNGSVRDTRRAKKEAKRSVKDAKDSRKAANALDNQNKKISQLTTDLTKNQNRLNQLDAMRAEFSDQQ